MTTQNDVQQLLARYTVAHDERRFDEIIDMFTEDAEYTMRIATGDPSTPTVGGRAIRDLIRRFKSTQTDQRRHIITNVVFEAYDADRARTRSYVTVLATEGDSLTVVSTGTCADAVVLQDGVWRFASKAMHLDKGF